MEKKKILIVDDNEISLRALKGYLSRLGYRVFSTTDPQEGFMAAIALPIDVCVFDSVMPVTGGAELCARVKKEMPELPIIIYSASLWPEDRLKSLEAGADGYILKDGVMDGLVACLLRVMK